MPRRRQIVGIDLFAGAGGMSLGAIQAGVDVILAVEKCKHSATTYRANFPDVHVIADDVRNVASLPPKPRDSVSVIFGGPPCQGFSTSNQRTRNAKNPENWLFREFVRLVDAWRPDWVVMENVKGIVETDGGKFLQLAVESLRESGYTTSVDFLNAVDFGVPQRRTRTFIVGSRQGYNFEFPKGDSLRKVSVTDAIRDLPLLSNGARTDLMPYGLREPSPFAQTLRNQSGLVTGNLVTKNAAHILERYRFVPPGGNWQNIPTHLMTEYTDVSRCHTGIYRRLDPAEPSVVIGNYRKNMLIHPDQDRGLSVREAARIQSIPDSFEFFGSIGFQQQQVGNMVPPLLAKTIFTGLF